MNVLLVSECSGNAIKETRRVLDQFAPRKGRRTWLTAITQQGLDTLEHCLRKTARKNTAVCCYRIGKKNHHELLWTVGNRMAFDTEGNVASHTTQRNILRTKDENQWHHGEVIALLAALAALFHDFGKANTLFQKKLEPGNAANNAANDTVPKGEPFRHEWVSFRLFQAFIHGCSDEEWLQKLQQAKQFRDGERQRALFNNLFKDDRNDNSVHKPSFAHMPPVAKVVAWLIVSHHRLPFDATKAVNFDESEVWQHEVFGPHWNKAGQRDADIVSKNWEFKHPIPLASTPWQQRAKTIATRALKCPALMQADALADCRFTSHLSRLCLILSDHYYSSLPPEQSRKAWQDPDCTAYANTDKNASGTYQLKQKLDEHHIGVAQNAYLLAKMLPDIQSNMPSIKRHRQFTRRATDDRFRWQNSCYDLACHLQHSSTEHGFFGINMASTGCGKTLTNARIMYGLSHPAKGCRFTVALGLRTLTLQTGDAYKNLLSLNDSTLATLIGSEAVKALHAEQLATIEQHSLQEALGSASGENFFEHHYVLYDGAVLDTRLRRWLKASTSTQKMSQLLTAPIVVSTIDHLIPATEGIRGGKPIIPTLRLLSADLVLDEPDEFGQNDLPALCRLVNWAGVMGSRVLLSSATLPPALVCALFDAYLCGRAHYNAVNGNRQKKDTSQRKAVCCAWFDEYNTAHTMSPDREQFKQQHKAFVEKRAARLDKEQTVKCKGQLLDTTGIKALLDEPPGEEKATFNIEGSSQRNKETIQHLAACVHQHIHNSHKAHNSQSGSCTSSGANPAISFGIVFMANINPLVALTKALMARAPQPGYRIHYLVYHGQHPLAIRSCIEARMDATLNRKKPDSIWQVPEVNKALLLHPDEQHIFVVLATSVATVGRDHDYDWAIAEPVSMGHLIQLGGRVRRHRQPDGGSETPNLLVLSSNFKALSAPPDKTGPFYHRPGFESRHMPLQYHDLGQLNVAPALEALSASTRIIQPPGGKGLLKKVGTPCADWIQQEHRALINTLFRGLGNPPPAAAWWQQDLSWCAQMQYQQPFRYSPEKEGHFFLHVDEYGDYGFKAFDTVNGEKETYKAFSFDNSTNSVLARGNHHWLSLEPVSIYQDLAERMGLDIDVIGERFGEIRLRQLKGEKRWLYEPCMGLYELL